MNTEVTVYTRNACQSCFATKRLLDKLNVVYTEVNVEDNLEVAQWLVDQGWRAMPVVTTEDDAWSGFQQKKITELAA